MDRVPDSDLPNWAPLVLAYAREPLRSAIDALLRFDRRLARIVATATEPTLAQIRLAWWRDELRKERENSAPPPSDPLLAGLLFSWANDVSPVIGLIDGWEALLEEQPWDENALEQFARGREGAFGGLARIAGHEGAVEASSAHGRCWAKADLALMRVGAPVTDIPNLPPLPKDLRSLAVIGGLARRSLIRGGKPLFGDRLSPLAALKLGIFGT